MNIVHLTNQKATFEKIFKEELLKFVCFFQDNLWDGYSDENDPKFISPQDFEGINALADKIEHMTLNVGCPVSVEGMLQSITERKIKRWLGTSTYENDYKKGKQLKSKDDLGRYKKSYSHIMNKDSMIIKGHFRWNNRGYILSRRCTDLLMCYLLQNSL